MSLFQKSLADKLKKSYKANILDLIIIGAAEFKIVESRGITVCALTKRVKKDIEALKLSANCFGLYSASANQFGLEYNLFLMGKHLKNNIWFDKELQSKINYNVIINPQIIGASAVMNNFLLIIYLFI